MTFCFALTSYLRWKRHVFQPAFVHLLNKRLFLEQIIKNVTGCIGWALFIHRHCAHKVNVIYIVNSVEPNGRDTQKKRHLDGSTFFFSINRIPFLHE